MNIQKMLKQVQKAQAQLAEKQAALAEETVEASVGGGKVTVTASGTGEILSIKISPDVVNPEDVEMLEDLVIGGVKQAAELARELQQSAMGEVTGGLGMPPGMGF